MNNRFSLNDLQNQYHLATHMLAQYNYDTDEYYYYANLSREILSCIEEIYGQAAVDDVLHDDHDREYEYDAAER